VPLVNTAEGIAPPGGHARKGTLVKFLRTGVLLTVGAVVGRAVAKKISAHRSSPHGDARWFTVTVNAPRDEVAGDRRLSEALAELGSGVETRIDVAPGDRGTEVAVRVLNTGAGSASSADEVRRVLREVKSLIETGEVVRPDASTTGKPTPGGALVRAMTRRAGGEGRL
jgi:hypothetical protein